MHEISIAESVIALVRQHLPSHQRLIRATVRIGPMHGVEAQAMEMAWNVASAGVGWSTSQLKVVTPPWRFRCVSCGRCWEPATVDEHCVCGGTQVDIMGGDEFQLESIEVDCDTGQHQRKAAVHVRGSKPFKTGVAREHQSTDC